MVVAEAANGEEGLEAIHKYRPDLVICDIRMPKMDGIEMVTELRNEGNETYVIFLTAYDDFAYAQNAVKLGASDYLLKPFEDGEAMNYIMEHYADSDIGVRKIAESLGLSEGHLSHTFKKETEYTINAYITRYRVRVAMKLLQNCRYKVYEVAEMVGYKDITYFSTIFKKIAGVTPSEYQDRIGGETE